MYDEVLLELKCDTVPSGNLTLRLKNASFPFKHGEFSIDFLQVYQMVAVHGVCLNMPGDFPYCARNSMTLAN